MLFKSVGNETFELFVSVSPNHENVIYVSKPEKGLIHITFKCFPFKLSHKKIGEGWGHSCPHCCTMLLNEVIHSEDHAH